MYLNVLKSSLKVKVKNIFLMMMITQSKNILFEFSYDINIKLIQFFRMQDILQDPKFLIRGSSSYAKLEVCLPDSEKDYWLKFPITVSQ